MGFGDFKDKAKQLGKEHADKIQQGIDKAADTAKEKFGHDEQVDKAAEKGKQFFDEPGDEPKSPE